MLLLGVMGWSNSICFRHLWKSCASCSNDHPPFSSCHCEHICEACSEWSEVLSVNSLKYSLFLSFRAKRGISFLVC